jgi:hypothetical protein
MDPVNPEQTASSSVVDRGGSKVLPLVMAVGCPIAALRLIWILVNIAAKYAPKTVAAVAIASLVIWFGSVVIAAMGVHRLLWRNRTSTVSDWAKGVLSLFVTVAWLGIFVTLLEIVFPRYFTMPSRRPEVTNGSSYADRLEQDPELKAFVRTVRNSGRGQALEQIVAEKTVSGFARLDIPARRRRLQLLREVLGVASDETCAAVALGTARPEEVRAAVLRLTSEQQAAWMEVALGALKAELRQTPPPPAASQEEIARVTAVLSAQRLGDPRLQSLTPDAGPAYARKLCRVVLDSYRTILQMPDELQSTALRMEIQFR